MLKHLPRSMLTCIVFKVWTIGIWAETSGLTRSWVTPTVEGFTITLSSKAERYLVPWRSLGSRRRWRFIPVQLSNKFGYGSSWIFLLGGASGPDRIGRRDCRLWISFSCNCSTFVWDTFRSRRGNICKRYLPTFGLSYPVVHRTFTYFIRGSLSVQLTSCLTGLDSTKHVNLLD